MIFVALGLVALGSAFAIDRYLDHLSDKFMKEVQKDNEFK